MIRGGGVWSLILGIFFSASCYANINCRHSFSSAVVTASGHSQNPLFDITKPETLHTLAQGLRFELLNLKKDPYQDNIDALYAQIPQIIAWLKTSNEKSQHSEAERLEMHLKVAQAAKQMGQPLPEPKGQSLYEQKQRFLMRPAAIEKTIQKLEGYYRDGTFTYYNYLRFLEETGKLFSQTSTVERRSQPLNYNATTTALKLLIENQEIFIASFDNDPSFLDFIKSFGEFNWANVRTTFSIADGHVRDSDGHLDHDVFAHAFAGQLALDGLTPGQRNALMDMKNIYLEQIRPSLEPESFTYADAVVFHILHKEQMQQGHPLKRGANFMLGSDPKALTAAAKSIIWRRRRNPFDYHEFEGTSHEIFRQLTLHGRRLTQSFNNQLGYGN